MIRYTDLPNRWDKARHVLKHTGIPVYLVGGCIRDHLLGRESLDMDFVSEDALTVAQAFADDMGGRFVLLDDERDTARVVGPNRAVFDFAEMQGKTIEEDLYARDFTLNAMAVDLSRSPRDKEVALIDPVGGASDMEQRLIRATSERAFTEDPLRTLRAYRFAAQLGFQIEPDTQDWLAKSVKHLEHVSWERIRDELLKILSVERCSPMIREMDTVGLLEQILPEIGPMRGLDQGEHHLYTLWEHTLHVFEALEGILTAVDLYFPECAGLVEDYLNEQSPGGSSRRTLLKLAALLHDVGKPETREIPVNGKVTFYDHEKLGAERAEEVCGRLRLSRRQSQMVLAFVRHHMRPLHLMKVGLPTQRAIYRFFRDTNGEGIGLLLLSLADLRGTGGVNSEEEAQWQAMAQKMVRMYYEAFQPEDQLPKLLSGKDVMEALGLAEGPEVGRILERIREAQVAGEVRDHESAIQFIQKVEI